MEWIDDLEKIKKEMWRNYHTESKPYIRVKILKEIKELQPYISAYRESTQSILEGTVKQFGTKEDRALSTASLNDRQHHKKTSSKRGNIVRIYSTWNHK